MRGWINGSAFLVLGLLIGCGGGRSEPSQAAPRLKTEQVIGKNGEVLWRTTVLGLDEGKQKDTLGKKGPAAKR